MTEREIISLLEKVLDATLDIVEPITLKPTNRIEIETLYKQLGKALDRKLGTRVGGTGLTGQI